MLRLVIPAAFAFLLGCQTVLSSLFLSVLGLRVRRLTDSLTDTKRNRALNLQSSD